MSNSDMDSPHISQNHTIQIDQLSNIKPRSSSLSSRSRTNSSASIHSTPIGSKLSHHSIITNRPNTAHSEASSQDLENRFKSLQKCVLDIEPDYAEIHMSGSALDVDALLDLLVGMYDECKHSLNNSNPRKSLDSEQIDPFDDSQKNNKTKDIKEVGYFSAFLDKYGPTVERVNFLRVNKADFEIVKPVAKGQYSTISMIQNKLDGEMYAMKIINKKYAMENRDLLFFMNERNLLVTACKSSWIPKLFAAFQDRDNLYLVMEYFGGGDLWSLVDRTKDFHLSETEAKFYLAELCLAIDEVHRLGYIHRDIKPHNILIDNQGHIRLCDFGSTELINSIGLVKSTVIVGTADYIAPEILLTQEDSGGKYSKEVDWWSFGVVMYEILQGDPPFYADTESLTYGKILAHEQHLSFNGDIPISMAAKDLILKLITPAEKRLGRVGIEEIMLHPFFNDIDWVNIRKTQPPYIPIIRSIYDTSNFAEPLIDDIEMDSGNLTANNPIPNGAVSIGLPNIDMPARNPRTSADLFTPGALGPIFEGRQLPFVGFTYQPGFVYSPHPTKARKSNNNKEKISRSTSPLIGGTFVPDIPAIFSARIPTGIGSIGLENELSSLEKLTPAMQDNQYGNIVHGRGGTSIEVPDPVVARTVQKLVQNTINHQGKWRTTSEKELLKELKIRTAQRDELEVRLKLNNNDVSSKNVEVEIQTDMNMEIEEGFSSDIVIVDELAKKLEVERSKVVEEVDKLKDLLNQMEKEINDLTEGRETIRHAFENILNEKGNLDEKLRQREELLERYINILRDRDEEISILRSKNQMSNHADIIALEETLRIKEEELLAERNLNENLKEEMANSLKDRQAEIRYIRKDAAKFHQSMLGELDRIKADFQQDSSKGYEASVSDNCVEEDEEEGEGEDKDRDLDLDLDHDNDGNDNHLPLQHRRLIRNINKTEKNIHDGFISSSQSSPTTRTKGTTLAKRSSSVDYFGMEKENPSQLGDISCGSTLEYNYMPTPMQITPPQMHYEDSFEQKKEDLILQIEELTRQRDEMLHVVENMREYRKSSGFNSNNYIGIGVQEREIQDKNLQTQGLVYGVMASPRSDTYTVSDLMVTAPSSPVSEQFESKEMIERKVEEEEEGTEKEENSTKELSEDMPYFNEDNIPSSKVQKFDSWRPSTVATMVPVMTPNESARKDALTRAYVEDMEAIAKRNHEIEIANSKLRRENEELRAARDVLEEELVHYMSKKQSRTGSSISSIPSGTTTPSSEAVEIIKSITNNERKSYKELQRIQRLSERRLSELEKENQQLRLERRIQLSNISDIKFDM